MKIAVLFASQSDDYVFNPLVENLERNHEVLFRVISSHREPEKLQSFLKSEEYDVVVAGAGLAAHLPGLAASYTNRPVFGVPVEACYGGLDSLLSIQQMPFGTPVLATSPYNQSEVHPLHGFINDIEKRKERPITVSVSESALSYEYVHLEYKRLREIIDGEGAAVEEVSSLERLANIEGFAINLVHEQERSSHLPHVVNVPLFEKNMKREPSRALSVFQWVAEGGTWVGVNNSCNAFLFLDKIQKISF